MPELTLVVGQHGETASVLLDVPSIATACDAIRDIIATERPWTSICVIRREDREAVAS